MSKRRYQSPHDAALVIQRNGGHITKKQIRCSRPGLRVLGAIDYLVNHCGYRWFK